MRIMIAGGGTGGHLFPALAVAEAFMDRDRGNQVLFVGSGRGLESSIVAREGYDLKTVEVASLKGKNIWGQLAGLMTIPRSIGQSGKGIHAFRPDLPPGL